MPMVVGVEVAEAEREAVTAPFVDLEALPAR
jgi:hypothetical protein